MSINHNFLTYPRWQDQLLATQVVFGAPGKNCAGSGICKLYTIHAARHLHLACTLTSVQFKKNEQEQSLTMLIPRTSLTPDVWEQQFSTGTFVVEEDFALPSWMSRKWQLTHLIIPEGGYPIHSFSHYLLVHLPLV